MEDNKLETKDLEKQFNVQKYIEAQGFRGQVRGWDENDPSKIRVTETAPDGTVQERKLNVMKMVDADPKIKELFGGRAPTKSELVINTPESKLSENALGFLDQIKFSMAGDAKSKQSLLVEMYGEKNVKAMEDGTFSVKEEGAWKNVGSGVAAVMAAELPVTASDIAWSITGAKTGAAVGSALMPGIGTLIGGGVGLLAGGAVGSGLAKLGTIEAAELLGIRDEQDAKTVKDEVLREISNSLIWGMAGGAAGKALKPFASAGKAFASRAKQAFDSFSDKPYLAEMMAQQFGTKKEYFETALRSVEDNVAVQQNLSKLDKYNTARLAGLKVDPVDPISREMVDTAMDFVQKTNKQSKAIFDATLSELDKTGVLNRSKANLGETLNSLKAGMNSLGLMDESGQFLTPAAARLQNVTQIADSPKEVKALRDVFDTIASVAGDVTAEGRKVTEVLPKPGATPFKAAYAARRKVDAILERAGQFNSDLNLSGEGRRLLRETRNRLDVALKDSLPTDSGFINYRGKRLAAKTAFEEEMRRSHEFLNVFDDFSLAKKYGKGSEAMYKEVSNLVLDKGNMMKSAFLKLGPLADQKAADTLMKIEQLASAKGLESKLLSSGPEVSIASMVASPIKSAQQIAQSVKVGSTTRDALKYAGAKAGQVPKMSARGFAEGPGASKMVDLSAWGKTSEFIRNMDPTQRLELFNNPAFMRSLFKPALEAERNYIQIQQLAEQEAAAQVQKKLQGQEGGQ